MKIKTIGSICSGIEAASVAWKTFDKEFVWFSEIANFPSKILNEKYPQIKNLGDMTKLPEKIKSSEICAPDLVCGGTPCQAFSLAGSQNGLKDYRGNLTLRLVDVIDASDEVRQKKNLPRTIVFWENVEGVLTDKTNVFGCLLSSLSGSDEPFEALNWPNSGILYGKKRNIAWRVLDSKYFGVPQQRRRLYLLAGGKEFHPENVLFEYHKNALPPFPHRPLSFFKDGHSFEIFREYTDCLYAAYGTKWNGNAAATNGSLFVVQDGNLRRLSPLETERLMGLPDNYTKLSGANKTCRYQAVGNSWVVPVVRWVGSRLFDNDESIIAEMTRGLIETGKVGKKTNDYVYITLKKNIVKLPDGSAINATAEPENPEFGNMYDIVSPDAPDDIYISPVACHGIVRRKTERNLSINPRLEEILLSCASRMPLREIETRSRIQKRGKYSSKDY